MHSWKIMLACCLLLPGCDLGTPVNETSPDAAAMMNKATKLDAYTRIMLNDDDLGGFNPAAQLSRYEELDIPHAAADKEILLFPRSTEQTLADLKQVRAQPGDLAALDAAADKAIPVVQRLLARLSGLNSYYATRGPLTDDFARGRREDPLLIADYKAAIQVWVPLTTAYESARDADFAESAAFYKRAGRMGDYYDVTMVQAAVKLLRLIDTPAAAGDAKRAAAADRIVDDLLAQVQRARAAWPKPAPAATGDSAEDALNTAESYEDRGVAGNMEELVGAWRDLRRAPDADHYAAMRRPYAAALQTVSLM